MAVEFKLRQVPLRPSIKCQSKGQSTVDAVFDSKNQSFSVQFEIKSKNKPDFKILNIFIKVAHNLV